MMFAEDPKKVAALFAPGAVMMATSSNQLRNTSELIQDYFKVGDHSWAGLLIMAVVS